MNKLQQCPEHGVFLFAKALLLCALLNSALADERIPEQPQLRWWKGNLHTHSLWSDGDDFPEMIAEWYRTHDYNFLALSDHNILSEGQRWMNVEAIERRGGASALGKYQTRFGQGWVQTRVEQGKQQVRLKPLDEFRYLVEERGKFILIPGEEISDRAEGKPVHMNATNIKQKIEPVGGATVREAMQNNLRMVQEQEEQLGRKIMLHLNHPNFGWAVTAEDLAAVSNERFYEVYNGHPAVNHRGDETRPSVERIWDIANTLRLQSGGEILYGIATDDSHDYHGEPGSHTGRGWVMVQSRYLTPEHLIDALRAGNFYASSGVELSSIHYDASARTIHVQVAADEGEKYQVTFIGSRRSEGEQDVPPDAVGVVLETHQGTAATYQLQGDELYVRAVVTSDAAPVDPIFEDQKKQAWTQPVAPSH